jgi:threonine dehydrogenase-like Zn-dependent dehydrogenase
MRAAVYHGARDIRIEEVPAPEAPGDGEVLVSVRRAAICGTDSSEWLHGPRLTRPPVILGHEFTGEVVDTPSALARWQGARVVSGAGVWCDACRWCRAGRTNLCEAYHTLGLTVDGGLAELVRVPVSTIVELPDSVGDDAAAVAQPFAVAIHAVRRAGIGPDDEVAVVGVGGIGAFIVAAAAARRPARLMALDVEPTRLRTAERLGADVGLEVRDASVDRVIHEQTAGRGASVVIEASGSASVPAAALAATARGGRLAIVGLQAAPRELDLFSAAVREVEITTSVAHVCREDLPEAVRLLAAGEVADAVIERTIALEELVERGIVPLAEGAATGKILVDPQRGSTNGAS